MDYRNLCFAILLFFIPMILRAEDRPWPRIIPTPQRVESLSGYFKINSSVRIVLGSGTSEEDTWSAERFNDEVRHQRDIDLRVVREEALRRLSENFIFIGPPQGAFAQELLKARGGVLTAEMKDEGYFLSIDSSGVAIIGETARGRFYGIMTLVQLIERNKRSTLLREVKIHDWPSTSLRGITDDISRGQVSTPENFKKIIRFLARYKLNTYCLYMEDMFAFRRHPAIGKTRGALTADEIKELDRYAKRHHVELIPIFQTLGHWENILSMPEYERYAEFPGAHTLNLADEKTYVLLEELIGEVAQAFSSSFFHIGADETSDVGLAATKRLVETNGLPTVYLNHYKRIFAMLKKHKKKPMLYGDMLLENPTILDQLPKDAVVVDWQYGASSRFESTRLFREKRIRFISSPAIRNYTGPFPHYLHSLVNIQNFARDAFQNGAIGLLTSTWNDFGGEGLRELNMYGYAWTAECAWQPFRAHAPLFNQKFFLDFFGNPQAATAGRVLYTILSEPFNQMNWHELWRHPMLPPRTSPMNPLIRAQSIESSMPVAREFLETLKTTATRNKDHAQLIEFVIDLNDWFAMKLRAEDQLRSLKNDSLIHNVDSTVVKNLSDCRALLERIVDLRKRFSELWLKTNRPEGLELLLARYDRQIAYWQEKMDELKKGLLWSEPTIASAWVYHPLANPFSSDTTATQIPQAYFRKAFTIEHPLAKAMMQVLAQTHAKVWINGEFVGEVSARRSLTLRIENRRARLWDVASHVKAGENVIAVEVKNYNRRGSAGFNLYGELRFKDTTIVLLSDSTWNVSDRFFEGWNNVQYSDSEWRKGAPKPYPWLVVRPNVSAQRTSWIEY
jgi:hexosaminidase